MFLKAKDDNLLFLIGNLIYQVINLREENLNYFISEENKDD